jgi:heme/copper-type cytochrome/quinol oxidase subunit 3
MGSGVYGSLFFIITGFHGIHVIVGTAFLSVQYYRMCNRHFTKHRHFGFEAAIMY